MSRVFVRLPEFLNVEEARRYCDRRGLRDPRLFAGPMGDEVRGSAEVFSDEWEDEPTVPYAEVDHV